MCPKQQEVPEKISLCLIVNIEFSVLKQKTLHVWKESRADSVLTAFLVWLSYTITGLLVVGLELYDLHLRAGPSCFYCITASPYSIEHAAVNL